MDQSSKPKLRGFNGLSTAAPIGIYARVSTGTDAQLHSIETQLPLIQEEAKAQGCPNPRTYIDVQTGKDQNRPQYQRLMADCKAGLLSAVIVTRLDRLQRDRRGKAEVIDYFAQPGTPNLITLVPRIDLSSAHLRGIAAIIGELGVIEVEQLSERVKAGHDRRRRERKVFGPKPPFGYQKTAEGYLEPDPVEWPIAKAAVERFLKDPHWTPLLSWFEAEHGIRWANNYAIRRWMLNPALAGGRGYGTSKQVPDPETGVVRKIRRGPGDFETIYWETDEGEPFQTPLLSFEELVLVKAVCTANATQQTRQISNSAKKSPHVLTGLVRCADCGINLEHHHAGKGSGLKLRCVTPGCQSRWKTVDALSAQTAMLETLIAQEHSIASDLQAFQRARSKQMGAQEFELRQELADLREKHASKPRASYETAIREIQSELTALLQGAGHATDQELEHFHLQIKLLEGAVLSGEVHDRPELCRGLLSRYVKAEASMGTLTTITVAESIRHPDAEPKLDVAGKGIGRTGQGQGLRDLLWEQSGPVDGQLELPAEEVKRLKALGPEGLIGQTVRGWIVLDGERSTVEIEITADLLGEWAEFLGAPKISQSSSG